MIGIIAILLPLFLDGMLVVLTLPMLLLLLARQLKTPFSQKRIFPAALILLRVSLIGLGGWLILNGWV